MKMPKVSIIVPIYNVEKYLDRCVQSIVNQTLNDIEIILVDDGSPDNCPTMCDEYAQKDNRIKVIHKPNAGLGYARNSGLEIATGKYVAFWDSDDYVELDMCKKLYTIAHDNNADIVFCGFNRIKNGLVIDRQSEESEYIEFKNEQCQNVLRGMLGNDEHDNRIVKYEMSVWHGIYKTDIIKNCNIQFCSERIFCSEDIIFHIDIINKCKKIAFIPDLCYNYCYNESSLTKSYRSDRIEKNIILFNEVLRRLKVNNYTFNYKEAYNLFLLKLRYDYTIITEYNFTWRQIYHIINGYNKKQCVRDLVNKIEFKNLPLRYLIFLLSIKCKLSLITTLIICIKNKR